MYLYLIPDDTDLNKTEFDMKDWYMETKNTFYVCSIVALQVFFFLMVKYHYSGINLKLTIVVNITSILLVIGVVLSRNTYYHCFFQFFRIVYYLGLLLAPR